MSESLCTTLFLAVVAAGVAVISWLYLRHRATHTVTPEAPYVAAWRAYAAARGYTLTVEATTRNTHRGAQLQGTLAQTSFVVDTFVLRRNDRIVGFTRIKSRAAEPAPLSLDLSPRTTTGTLLSHLFDATDPSLGDPAFDARFVLRTDARDGALALLDAPARAALVALPPSAQLSWRDGDATLTWVGFETSPDVLDAACRAIVALCRWRRDPQLYR